MNEKSREKQARRMAARLGFVLRKSRTDGTWMVIDPKSGTVVASGWDLEQVEQHVGGQKGDER